MTEMTAEHSEAHDHIHLPPPSFWPLILGLGFFIFSFGLIVRSGHIDSWVSLSIPLVPTLPWLSAGTVIAAVGLLILLGATGGWLTGNIKERMAGPTLAGDSKLAMWIFLGNETLFFTGLIASFLLLRFRAPDPQVDHALINSIPLVSLNTFILLTSSLTVVLAHDAAVKGKRSQLILFLVLTIIFGITFVSMQGVEYSTLYAENLKWTTSGFGTAFFTLTGTHGLHVIIGIIWCIFILIRALQGGFTKEHYGGVEIFGLYWHFVDVVWILLFTLVYLMHRATPEVVQTAGHLLAHGFGLW